MKQVKKKFQAFVRRQSLDRPKCLKSKYSYNKGLIVETDYEAF
jgi:hypothetical protein